MQPEQVVDLGDFLLGTEHMLRIGHPFTQLEKRGKCRFIAVLIVVRMHVRVGGSGLDFQLILQFVGYLDVAGVNRICKRPGRKRNVWRVKLFDRELVYASLMKNLVDILVFVDNHYREIAIAGIRDGQSRPLADINDSEAVERIAIHANHVLLIERRGHAIMVPAVNAAGQSHVSIELECGLCPHVIVDVYLYALIGVWCVNYRSGESYWSNPEYLTNSGQGRADQVRYCCVVLHPVDFFVK